MELLYLFYILYLIGAVLASSPRDVAKHLHGYRDARKRADRYKRETEQDPRAAQDAVHPAPQYLNSKTQRYAVNGSGIPGVTFGIGESYAGLLPISNDSIDRELYFWFFPSQNPLASDEITIWLNGGPGCSSLTGLLKEIGPFQWQSGTFRPVPNPWTWVNLTNMVYVEQPVGTGYSTGTVKAKTEVDVANEFKGFFKNFVDLFGLHGRKIYVTGESYAGMYIPYIASTMLDTLDTKYFNVNGIMINDPLIGFGEVFSDITAVPFVDHWSGLFALNQTFMDNIHERDVTCGYPRFREETLEYPPKGKLPSPLDVDNGGPNCSIYSDIIYAAQLVNPCWNIYNVAAPCPLLWDVLGRPGTSAYSPTGATIYFNRPDVKKAINAPDKIWTECTSPVYNTSDGGSYEADHDLWSGLTVLPGVIERVSRTIIGHADLDMVLIKNGTLITIQNMTWHGVQGFSEYPSDEFFVPYHTDYEPGAVAGAGIMGKTRTERGLTFVEVNFSGHMVPQYQPSAAYRMMEFLLGRIPSLSSRVPFTNSTDGLQALPPGPGA